MNESHNPRYVDAQRFSENASQLLLDGGRLAEFFDSIGLAAGPDHSGEGYIGLCPACRDSNRRIGIGGYKHRIWWKCLSRSCPSNREDFRTPKNLLSLTKFLTGDQARAFAAIAGFLGYEGRSFDITNGRFKPAGATADPSADFGADRRGASVAS